jgi:hypothetical protein
MMQQSEAAAACNPHARLAQATGVQHITKGLLVLSLAVPSQVACLLFDEILHLF